MKDDLDWCEPCHAPVIRMGKLEMIRNFACYIAVLWWPDRFFLSAPHRWALGHAGSHAYRCGCWPKIALTSTRERLTGGEEG